MVSIDNVYQKVLAIANKEQRGYITPQEFNLFADQAQLDIFEQYFYDINQWTRQHGNDHAYADMLTGLEEKINLFKRYNQMVDVYGDDGLFNIGNFASSDGMVVIAVGADDIVFKLPSITTAFPDLYRLGTVRVDYDTEPKFVEAEQIKLSELQRYGDSPLYRWSKKRPQYTQSTTTGGDSKIKVYPYPADSTVLNTSGDPLDRVLVSYVRKPTTPNWGYVVVNGYAQYNGAPAATTDFELHPSEENNLILKVLQLSGIVMRDANLYQIVSQEEIKDIQQEKQ